MTGIRYKNKPILFFKVLTRITGFSSFWGFFNTDFQPKIENIDIRSGVLLHLIHETAQLFET